jgi:capsular polysaccharide biosynthesis protein
LRFKGRQISRVLPENFAQKDLFHFKSDLEVVIPEIDLLSLSNVILIQRYLYKRNGIILGQYVHTHGVSFKTRIKSALKPLFYLGRKKEVEKGIWALDTWSKGYFHWLTDFLPRCISAEEYWKDYTILIPSYYLELGYINESCKFFGFEVLPYEISGSYTINNLILPSRLQSCAFDPDQIKNVRSKFREYDGFDEVPIRRIYISRSKSLRRKITNEEEMESVLKSFGFESFCLESLSFSEQRKLMSESSWIVSNHGAGLTNMIFLPEHSKVLELKADVRTINNCYFNLARALDHEYYYLLNESDSEDIQKANIKVDTNKLRSILEKIL